MAWDPSTWERCAGMNGKKEQCNKTKGAGRHISHKKHWIGGWYGLLSHKDPRDRGYGENKSRPEGPKRKDSKGIWRW